MIKIGRLIEAGKRALRRVAIEANKRTKVGAKKTTGAPSLLGCSVAAAPAVISRLRHSVSPRSVMMKIAGGDLKSVDITVVVVGAAAAIFGGSKKAV